VMFAMTATSTIFAQQAPPPRMAGTLAVDRVTMAPLQIMKIVELEQTASDVFEFLTTHENWPKTFPSINSLELDNSQAPISGKTGAMRVFSMIDGAEIQDRIIAFDEPNVFAWSIEPGNAYGLSDHLGVFEVRSTSPTSSELHWHQYFHHDQAEQIGVGFSQLMDAVAQELVARGGGELQGSASGVGLISMIGQRTVSASPDEVWEVLGNQFGDLDKWSTIISHASLDQKKPGVGVARACDTAVGSFRETLVSFDENSHSLSYVVDQGMPPVVAKAQNSWKLEPTKSGGTKILMNLEINMVPGAPGPASGAMKSNMFPVVDVTLDDLAHYLETGKPRSI